MHPKHPISLGDVKNNPASPLGYEMKHDLGEAQVAMSSVTITCDTSLRLQSESTIIAWVM